jgi:hypothetical protein
MISAEVIFALSEDHPNDAQINQFDAASRTRDSGFSAGRAGVFCGCADTSYSSSQRSKLQLLLGLGAPSQRCWLRCHG